MTACRVETTKKLSLQDGGSRSHDVTLLGFAPVVTRSKNLAAIPFM